MPLSPEEKLQLDKAYRLVGDRLEHLETKQVQMNSLLGELQQELLDHKIDSEDI